MIEDERLVLVRRSAGGFGERQSVVFLDNLRSRVQKAIGLL